MDSCLPRLSGLRWHQSDLSELPLDERPLLFKYEVLRSSIFPLFHFMFQKSCTYLLVFSQFSFVFAFVGLLMVRNMFDVLVLIRACCSGIY